MPNLATMTAAQLSQEIGKIQRKRSIIAAEQAASDAIRAGRKSTRNCRPTVPPSRLTSGNRVRRRRHTRRPTACRAAPSGRSTTAPVGPNMEFYSGNFGQFGVIFNPSSY